MIDRGEIQQIICFLKIILKLKNWISQHCNQTALALIYLYRRHSRKLLQSPAWRTARTQNSPLIPHTKFIQNRKNAIETSELYSTLEPPPGPPRVRTTPWRSLLTLAGWALTAWPVWACLARWLHSKALEFEVGLRWMGMACGGAEHCGETTALLARTGLWGWSEGLGTTPTPGPWYRK